MEKENDLKGLKEEAKVYEREILSMLLEVSQSFVNDSFSKEKREEIFNKIDSLREKVKDIAKIIDDVENRKYDFAYIDTEKNNEKADEVYKLEKVDVVRKEEKKDDFESEKIEPNISDLTDEDLSNIDEVIEKIEKKEVSEDISSEQVPSIQGELNNDILDRNDVKSRNNTDIQELTFEDAIGKIDKLIKEAKDINNNIIKFPEEKVLRRNGYREYEKGNEEDKGYISYEDEILKRKEKINFEKKQEKKDIFEEINNKSVDKVDNIEPVPVLFGNSRAQNQMIIRKKSSGFSDKLRSLIFKIKTILGGEDEKK